MCTDKKLIMGTARFGFRDKKSKTIYFFYRNGEPVHVRWSTKIKIIERKHWDNKNQKIRETNNERGAYSKNAELRKIMRFFDDQFPQNKTETELTELLNQKFKNKKDNLSETIEKRAEKKMELFEYFKSVIDNDVTKKTKSTYQNCYNYLKRYNKNLTFDDINLSFYDNFTRFLKSARTTQKGKPLPNGYGTNTRACAFKVLKTVMRKSYNRNLHSNRSYNLEGFKVEFEEGEQIYLSDEKLTKIIDLKLEKQELIDARKYFIIGCYSSLRIGDVLRVDENFFNGDMIIYVPSKGDKPTNRNKPISVPANSKIKAIISGGLPKIEYRNDEFNKLIKELCRLANIEEYQEVASHTMRRSFCVNAYKSGMDLEDVSFLMGHSSTRVTRNYLKINNTERAELLQEKHAFLK